MSTAERASQRREGAGDFRQIADVGDSMREICGLRLELGRP
jgi:hypothetical protein